MSISTIIWIMASYIYIQYIFARYVAWMINKIDPGYFEFNEVDNKMPTGIKTSFGITSMIFDSDLPDPCHGSKVRISLYLLRFIYAFTIPLVIILWII